MTFFFKIRIQHACTLWVYTLITILFKYSNAIVTPNYYSSVCTISRYISILTSLYYDGSIWVNVMIIWWRLAKVTYDYNHFIPFPGWPWNEAATSKRPTIQPSTKCAFKRIKFLGAMTVSQVPRVIFRGFAQSSWERLPGWVAVSPSHTEISFESWWFLPSKIKCFSMFQPQWTRICIQHLQFAFRFSLSETTQSDKAIPTLDKSNLATALALFTKFFSAKERHARLKCCITLPACQGAATVTVESRVSFVSCFPGEPQTTPHPGCLNTAPYYEQQFLLKTAKHNSKRRWNHWSYGDTSRKARAPKLPWQSHTFGNAFLQNYPCRCFYPQHVWDPRQFQESHPGLLGNQSRHRNSGTGRCINILQAKPLAQKRCWNL